MHQPDPAWLICGLGWVSTKPKILWAKLAQLGPFDTSSNSLPLVWRSSKLSNIAANICKYEIICRNSKTYLFFLEIQNNILIYVLITYQLLLLLANYIFILFNSIYIYIYIRLWYILFDVVWLNDFLTSSSINSIYY